MFGSSTRAPRALLAALAVVAWAGFASLGAALAQDRPEVIRIGSTAPGHLKFILAKHNGWLAKEFAEDGIEIELVAFTGGGSEASTALATGALQFAYIGNNPGLRLAAAGGDAKLIGLSSWVRSSGSAIIVRKDSPIDGVEDLAGKKVAYLQGTVRHSSLAKALKTVGLTLDDIESLNLNFEASGPALLRGDVDALVETDNTAQRLVETGEARVILDGNDYPEWSVPNVILVNGTFAEQYPDIVERLLAVDLRLAKWADQNYDETIRIFVKGTAAAEKSTRRNYRDGVFYQDPTITDEATEAFKREEDFMADAGLLNGSVDYDSWVDTSYLEAARSRAETVVGQ